MATVGIGNLVRGSAVIPKETLSSHELGIVGLSPGEICRIQDIEVVSRSTILPQDYIDAGIIPQGYRPHLIRGIRTTNHDIMGSDRFFSINGTRYSAAWFRPATSGEVNMASRKNI